MALSSSAQSPTAVPGAHPRGLRLEHRGDALRISFPWRSRDWIALAILSGVFLFVILPVVWMSPEPGARVAALVLTPVGCILGWAGLAGLLNHTIIQVDRRTIRVNHRPIPWPGNVRLRADQILQLYVWGRTLGPRSGPLARVFVAMEDGRRIPLTWFLRGDRAAWSTFMEKQIEQHLQIVNRPIVCMNCGYDLRVSVRKCPECGWRLPARNKHERRSWARVVSSLLRRDAD